MWMLTLPAFAASLPADYDPPKSLAPLVKTLHPAVVALTVKQEVSIDKENLPFWFTPFLDRLPDSRVIQGEGSGFLISPDGYILTNNHVVADATSVTVLMDDQKEYEARVIGTDPRTDIALVKVDTKESLPFVKLGDSGKAEVGDWVVAIGNPFGLEHTVSAGIISAKGRVIGAGPYDDFIQTDASINPGNSGGPLFNTAGEVIGINTAITSNGQGIGFAVPIDMVKPAIDELKTKGKVSRGWIGVSLADLPKAMATQMGAADGGVAVGQVYPDTPGAKAGLAPGDVVTEVDGVRVTKADALVRAIGTHKPGEVLELTVLKDGKSKKLRVTLAERPEEKSLGRSGTPSGAPVEVAELGITLKGLVISAVDEEGPAQGRLLVGDTLLELNRHPVKSGEEVRKLLTGVKDVVTVLVKRNDATVFVPVPLGD